MSESPVLSDAPAHRKESAEDGSAARPRQWRVRIDVGVACGVGILVLMFAMAYVAPLIRPFSANEVAGAPFAAPNGTHWLGTDDLGRDYFVRLCVAGRTSLSIALAGSVLALVAGS